MTDNCNTGSVTITFVGDAISNQSCSNKYQITRTYRATDACGNFSDCQQIITVNDNTAPTFTAPANLTLNCNQDYTNLALTGDVNNEADNCGSSLLQATYSDDFTHLAGCNTTGFINRTWSLNDGCGNITTHIQTITIVDNTLPQITCLGNQSRNANAGVCTYTATGTEFDPTSATDNCGVQSVTYTLSGATSTSGTTTLSGIAFAKGITTVAWTVADACGSTATCIFTVTVSDAQNPSITCIPNLSFNVDPGECNNTVSAANLAPASYSDNCTVSASNLSWTLTGATTGSGTGLMPNTDFNPGTTTVTYTITDASSNSASCSFTVRVTDNIDPSITCIGNLARNVDAGQCNATIAATSLAPASYSDNCTVTSSNLSWTMNGATTGSGSGLMISTSFNVGTTTVTYTITDASNNAASCSFDVVVTDNIDPTINCVANIARNVDANQCNATIAAADLAPASYNDNCTVTATNLSWEMTGATIGSGSGLIPQTGFNVGTTTVTYTLTDAHSRISTCSFTVTITDNTNPTISCGGNLARNVDAGECNATIPATALAPASYSDNCALTTGNLSWSISGATTGSGSGLIPQTDFNVGISTVTYTVTDAVNRTATCSFTVTVTDNIDPTISCLTNISRNVDAGGCSATVSNTALIPTYGDNCTVSSGNLSWTTTGATTGSGLGLMPQTAFNIGTTTVTFTITDPVGRTANCSFTVTVTDNIDPTISCVGNLTRNVDPGECYAMASNSALIPTYADNCTVTASNLSWTMTGVTTGNGTGLMPQTDFNVGTTTVTYTITDGVNRTASCSFTVTVTDNIDPTISCVSNIVRNVDTDECNATIAGASLAPTYSDNCPVTAANLSWTMTGATTGTGTGLMPQTDFNTGTTTVIYLITDSHGRTANCNFLVTITDNIDPTISCLSNLSRNVDVGECSATIAAVTLAPASYGDNCTVNSGNLSWTMSGVTTGSGIGLIPQTAFNVGATSITYTITDASNRTASCIFTVTVTDNINPTISCVANLSRNVDTGSCYASIPATALNPTTYNDNCNVSNSNLSWSMTGATINSGAGLIPQTNFNVGITTVNYTITDSHGRTSSCSFSVTVTDNIDPTISCAGNMARNVDAGNCYATISSSLLAPVVYGDNCTVTSGNLSWVLSGATTGVGSGLLPQTAFNIGTTTVTYTITDAHSRTASCSFTVTVTDNIDPTISCVANLIRNVDPNQCNTTISATALAPNTYGDNCTVSAGNLSWTMTGATTGSGSGLMPQTDFNLGASTITYTITDAIGRTASCSFIVTVNDNINPVISCPAAVSVSVNINASYMGLIGMATATDNCNLATTIINNAPTLFPVGSTTVIWTATDGAGNSASCSQNITVTNAAPTAVDDVVTVLQSTASAPTSVNGNVLLNDIDPEDQMLTVSSWTSPASGTLVTNANGTFTYTPVTGFIGTVTFDYVVCDEGGQCDTGTISVNVGACVMPPSIPGPVTITK